LKWGGGENRLDIVSKVLQKWTLSRKYEPEDDTMYYYKYCTSQRIKFHHDESQEGKEGTEKKIR
jgi:hypothetical protein